MAPVIPSEAEGSAVSAALRSVLDRQQVTWGGGEIE
jgi:hypothetical protein